MKKALLYIISVLGFMAGAQAQVSIVNITTTNVTCNGGTDGSVTLTVTGGQTPYIYTLQKGSDFLFSPAVNDTFYTFTNVRAATWIVLVQDDNENADFGYGPVTQPSAVTVTSETSVPISCNGFSDGKITVSASGESGSYLFTLNPGGASNVTGQFQGLGPGNYTVTVTDASGCPSSDVSDIIPVSDPAVISVLSGNATDLSCNGSDDGKVSVAAAGGTGAYTFTLNPGAVQTNSTGSFSGLGPGIYSVDVTDVNACPSATSNPLTVNEPSAVQINSENKTDISCHGAGDGTITITATGGTGPYQYTLAPGSVSNSSGLFTNLTQGTYHVSVTDANGCGPAVSSDMVINEPAALVITSQSGTDITCHNVNDGTITITSTGGTPTVTYTINPGGASNQTGVFSNLAAGIYTVDAQDAGSCPPVTSSPVTIINPPAITISTQVKTDISCNGAGDGSITIAAGGGTGTLHFTLMPGNVKNTTGIFTALGPGIYTVSVTDDNACASAVSSPLTINEPAAISVSSENATDISCSGNGDGTVTVTASGGTSPYLFTLTPGSISNATGSFTNLQAGTYTVSISDAKACPQAISSPLTVIEPDPMSVAAKNTVDITCNGSNNGEIHVSVDGGTLPLNYTLNPGSVSNGTGDFINLAGGTYSVTVNDANACPPLVIPALTITDPAVIGIVSVNSTNISCHGDINGKITVVASGGTGLLHYTLMPGSVTNTTGIFSGLAGGSYSVSVTDDNTCSPASTGPVTINEPAVINASVDGTSLLAVSCHGDVNGSVDITVTGGTPPYQFSWTGPGGYTSPGEDISGLAAGTYNLTVKDAANCSAVFTSIAVITEPPQLGMSLTASDVTCNGDANGSVTVTAAGGTSPYMYSRNGITYQGSNIFSSLIKNTYTFYVRDAGSCIVSDTISVDEPDELQVASEIRIDNNKCFGDSLGEIRILSITGGTAPYTYSINNGLNFFATAIFQNLGAGSYQTVVKDASGCTALGNNNLINQPSKIRITNYAQVDVSGCFGNINGKIAIEATGGTGVKKYGLDGGITNINGIFNNVTGGDHVIGITDANNCLLDTLVNLAEPVQITFTSVTLTDVTGCHGDANGKIEALASGGTGLLLYAIDGGAFTPGAIFNGLTGGDHTLSVKDANNCQKDTIVTLSEPAAITIGSLTSTNASCAGYDNGTVTVSAAGGTLPYSYTLQPAGTNNSTGIFKNIAPGTYTIDINDSKGCGPVTSVPVVITEPVSVNIDSVTTTPIFCAGISDAQIHIYASGGTSPYQYSIDDEANYYGFRDFTGLTPGIYAISLKDANNCKIYIDTVTFDEPPALVVDNQSVTDVTTCSYDSSGSITYQLSGGTGAIDYSLDGTNWQPAGIFNNLPGGDYTVFTRDANGCSKNSPLITVNSPDPITAVFTTTPALDEANKGSITISNAGGGTGTLTFSINGTAGPFVSETVFTGLDAGDFDVVVKDDNDCTFERTVTVSAVPPLTVTVIVGNISCNGAGDGSILLNATDATGQAEYSIDDSLTWQADGSYTGLLPGEYIVFARDGDGRYFSDTVTISEPLVLGIFTNITPAKCSAISNDGAVVVTVNGATGTVTYDWSNGATSKDLNNIAAGSYILTATDENGCSVTDTIDIPAITTVTANAGADTTVCPGTVLTLNGQGATDVTWHPAGGLSNPNLPNPVVTIDSTVSYILTTVGMNDCSDIDTITISVYPSAGLSAGNDTILTGSQVSLTAAGGPFISYSWTPAGSLNDSTSATVIAAPAVTTSYIVVAVTEDGCIEKDTVSVIKPDNLIIYTAFSPNGDGANDYWDIDNAFEYPDIIVEVYNRWGEKLFSSKGYSDDKRWDGTYKGKPAPIGTYYYVVVPFKGAKAITGPLTIIR